MDITRLLPALVLALCSTASLADTLEQTFEFYAPLGAGSDGSDQIDPYFDPALGTLTQVRVGISVSNELTSNFKDTCGLDDIENECYITGDLAVGFVGALWSSVIWEDTSNYRFWFFDPVTEDPRLFHAKASEDFYPETAWAQFYTSGDSSTISWYTWFQDHNSGLPSTTSDSSSASDSGELNISVTFTYTYDPIDADGDGVPDIWDAYPNISLGGRLDTDNDGIPNDCDAACIALGMAADLDDDDDGVPDVDDAYPEISLGGRLDTDNDGIPNDCNAFCISLGMLADLDDDADDWADSDDNCRLIPNNAQLDSNEDGCGDACNVVLPGCGLVACVNN